jgi:2-oxoglutarate ferredoxin oxidoreductase subunit alpha
MNPAALMANIKDLRPRRHPRRQHRLVQGKRPRQGGLCENPLEDGSLSGFRLYQVEITRLTRAGLSRRRACRSAFRIAARTSSPRDDVLPVHRSMDVSTEWIKHKFAGKPELAAANTLALKGGYAYCEAAEIFQVTYEVPPAHLKPGTYRNISGQPGPGARLVAAAQKAGRPLFLGSYPITPASDILHELSQYKNFGVYTFQAEDEIAAIGSALGASFAGSIGPDDHLRPRHGPQDGVHRAGDHGRAAARHRGHPARRPVDGLPRRPSRPTCFRRSSGGRPRLPASYRRTLGVGLLRGGLRGDAAGR